MSFVTFPSRTRSRRTKAYGKYMRLEKQTATEDARPLEVSIIDALNYFDSALRPFHVAQKQAPNAFMSSAVVRRIRRHMRKMEVLATLILIAEQLSRLRVTFISLSKGNRVAINVKEDSARAHCRLPETPDEFAEPVLPQVLQALLETGSDSKDVLDSSVPDISLKSAIPSSMSRRRLSCNMPTLQRILPLHCVPQFTMHSLEGFKIPFPVHASSTPITPLDQIIHTPRNPPVLKPDARQGTWSPVTGADSIFDSPLQVISPSASPSVRMAGQVRRAMPPAPDRRRLSVVAPPEAPPMHAPRRLSYSKAFGKHNNSSPLSSRMCPTTLGEGLACCPENELLASPLAIRTSTSTSQKVALDTCGVEGIFSTLNDLSFTLAMSPRATKV